MFVKHAAVFALLLSLATISASTLYGDDPADSQTSFEPLGAVVGRLPVAFTVASDKPDQSHPLLPTLKIAHEGYQRIGSNVRDYTCTLVKREKVDGQLLGPEVLFAKVRHEQVKDGQVIVPHSVYLKFKAPERLQNREVLFVQGHANDKLIVRKGGKRLAFITVALDPTSPFAMTGNRYPITEFGILRLIERMILLGNSELEFDECEVEIRDDVAFQDQVCQRIEVKHPVRRPHFEYHSVKIYIDNKLRVPIRFESYDWPQAGSDDPVLLEEYTYLDVKLNVGLTDLDFDRANPDYRFR